jgi:MATE family, multidrug efflux pump
MMLCRALGKEILHSASGSNAAARLSQDAPSKRCSSPLAGKEHLVSDQSATISTSFLATPKPAHKPAQPAAPAAAARTKLLLEGPIMPTLLRLSAPNVLNLAAFAGVITFDGFFLGRISTNAFAGASLAFPWVMLVLQTTNSGMGNGVSSAIARALGAGRRDRADALVFHAFLLALALGAIFSTVLLLAAPFMFGWMGGRDEMLSDALSYANVALGGAVCICVLNLLGNAVRGTGNMSLHASVLVACVVAHIAISPVLIFGFGPLPALGPAGAGWGLVIPFAVGALVIILYLRSPRAGVRLAFAGVTPRWDVLADILKVGIPGLINTAITNLSVVILTGLAGQLGRETAVGYAMGVRLEYVMQPIAFGFGTAMLAMVGTNWGSLTIAAVCGTIGLIVAIHPGLWLGLFSSDPDAVRLGSLYVRIVGPLYACFGLGLGLFFVMQGIGRAIPPVIANAVRLVTSAVGGLVAITVLDLGTAGFCAAVAIGFAVYAALLVRAVLRVEDPPASKPAGA